MKLDKFPTLILFLEKKGTNKVYEGKKEAEFILDFLNFNLNPLENQDKNNKNKIIYSGE
jgi:hypothetical protein